MCVISSKTRGPDSTDRNTGKRKAIQKSMEAVKIGKNNFIKLLVIYQIHLSFLQSTSFTVQCLLSRDEIHLLTTLHNYVIEIKIKNFIN